MVAVMYLTCNSVLLSLRAFEPIESFAPEKCAHFFLFACHTVPQRPNRLLFDFSRRTEF
jgi:hypothetical protein